MLISFKVQNYRLFRAEQNLLMTASKHVKTLPENTVEYPQAGLGKTSFLTSAGIFGANATGKTDLLRALADLQKFVIESHEYDATHPTCAVPYKSQPGIEEPTVFEVNFATDKRYTYTLSVTPQRVVYEALTSEHKNTWFVRTWHPETQDYHYEFPLSLPSSCMPVIANATPHNVAYLSRAIETHNPAMEAAYEWFKTGLLCCGFNNYISPDRTIERIASHRKQQIVDVLSACDIGITDVNIINAPVGIEHRATTDNLVFSFKNTQFGYEDLSSGTKRVFAMLGYMLDAIKTGSTLLVNDIDASLHPLLLVGLLECFNNTYSKHKAQIIYTSHSPILLDETVLRYDQIWFTGKDKQNASILYPLTEYKVRKDESLMKGYLAGRYGGVPFIPNGLIPQK